MYSSRFHTFSLKIVLEEVDIWCAQIFLMALPCICKYFLKLNTKLCNVKINNRKIVITFVATFLLGKFSKDLLTTLIPLELEILVNKDLTFRNTKYELSGVFSVFFFIFCKKSLVFAELLAEGDNLHTLKYLMCGS